MRGRRCQAYSGYFIFSTGAYEQARPLYDQAIAMFRKLYPVSQYPDGHPENLRGPTERRLVTPPVSGLAGIDRLAHWRVQARDERFSQVTQRPDVTGTEPRCDGCRVTRRRYL